MPVPKVIILSEVMRGKSFELTKDLYSIGRSEERDVCIPDGTISSYHAELIKTDVGYTARDCNSTNGTRVNGVRITEQALNNSDILQVGGVEMLFDCEDKANATTQTTTQTKINIQDLDHTVYAPNDAKMGNIYGASKAASGSGEDSKVKILFYVLIGVLVIIVVVLAVFLIKKLK
jgi:Inner membrane component of T3SS, cytoplasmic domain